MRTFINTVRILTIFSSLFANANCVEISESLLYREGKIRLIEVSPLKGDRRSQEKLARAIIEAGGEVVSKITTGGSLLAVGKPRVGKVLSRRKDVEFVAVEEKLGSRVWKKGKAGDFIKAAPASEQKIWAEMPHPMMSYPDNSLRALRKAARDKGIVFVVPGAPTHGPEALREMEELYGGKILFVSHLPESDKIFTVPGVLIHVDPDRTALRFRGDINLTLGHGRMYGLLDKVGELKIARTFMPEAMPRGFIQAEANAENPVLKNLYDQATGITTLYLEGSAKAELVEKAVTEYLHKLFLTTHTNFPSGAFIKWADDYATRENGALWTTQHTLVPIIAKHMKMLRSLRKRKITRLDHPKVSASEPDGRAAVMRMMFVDPNKIIIQELEDVAKTKEGALMEFRVEVLRGHVVLSRLRMSNEHYPQEAKLAEKAVQRFLASLPPNYQYLTAGFDVIQNTKGDFKIVEFNAGPMSSFITPGILPLHANDAYSNLFGRKLPAIKKLEAIFKKSVWEQGRFVNSFLPNYGRLDTDSFSHLKKDDLIHWFARRYLEEYLKSPTPRNAKATLEKFTQFGILTYDHTGAGNDAIAAFRAFFERERQRQRTRTAR